MVTSAVSKKKKKRSTPRKVRKQVEKKKKKVWSSNSGIIKKNMLDTFSTVIKAENSEKTGKSVNDHCFQKEVHVLSKVPASKRGRKVCRSLLEEIANEHNTM